MSRLVVALIVALSLPSTFESQTPPVRPADLSRLSVDDFRDDELDLPYYLANFHRVANSVALSGPRRGFIDIPVWRDLKDNQPYNARIMENILSLAYFYCTNRPWNPYRGDPALRARLEAALDFWARSQSPDGRLSEYAPQQWSLAPTAFATKFMGESLRLLRDGPPIDAAIHRRAVEADRKAIMAVFTRPDLRDHGRMYTNQFSNAFAGALAYLALYPDSEMETALRVAMADAEKDHQSPVGYFYEAGGPDWGYDLNTHHSNFIMAWRYAKSTPLAAAIVRPMTRWYEWLAYNAVVEPGTRSLTLNRAIESRQRWGTVAEAGASEAGTGNPIAEVVPGARVLGPTREELAKNRAAQRAALAKAWPKTDSLAPGSFRAFSPYAFLHRSDARWDPSEDQWRAARAGMRPEAERRFVHQRVDSRQPATFTFVRRPSYYASFASGPASTSQQRFGLGLLWNPDVGTMIQSQSAGILTAWGTRADSLVYEATSIVATYVSGAQPLAPSPGARDLPDAELRASYPLGESGTKLVVFDEAGVHVDVRHLRPFSEQIPMILLDSDSLESVAGQLLLRRSATRLAIRWAPATAAVVTQTSETVGSRRVVAVAIPARGSLHYDISLEVSRRP
jgi:hypothetical protein